MLGNAVMGGVVRVTVGADVLAEGDLFRLADEAKADLTADGVVVAVAISAVLIGDLVGQTVKVNIQVSIVGNAINGSSAGIRVIVPLSVFGV